MPFSGICFVYWVHHELYFAILHIASSHFNVQHCSNRCILVAMKGIVHQHTGLNSMVCMFLRCRKLQGKLSAPLDHDACTCIGCCRLSQTVEAHLHCSSRNAMADRMWPSGLALTVAGPNGNDRVGGHVVHVLNIQYEFDMVHKRLFDGKVSEVVCRRVWFCFCIVAMLRPDLQCCC